VAWTVPVLLGKGVELVDQTLAMNPAKAVLVDIELTGVIADDDAAANTTIGSSIASSTEASSTPLRHERYAVSKIRNVAVS
jgi:hypothetical protein